MTRVHIYPGRALLLLATAAAIQAAHGCQPPLQRSIITERIVPVSAPPPAAPLAAPLPAVTMPVWLPPKQFDHPYPGVLVTARVKSSDELKTVCIATWQPGYDVGCTQHLVGGCLVTVLEDELLVKRGFIPEQVMRHEIGHCNGWGGDHAGKIDPRD
jgi:hypothetical protein